MPKNRLFTICLVLLTSFCCDRAVNCQTSALSGDEILVRMAAQYANASSYQDTGVVIDVKGESGPGKTANEFKTYFQRPQLFRFEWTDSLRSPAVSEEVLNVVWSDGKQTKRYYSWDDPQVETARDISFAIAGATGISRGAAHVVPTLLMEDVSGFRLIETANVTLAGEEKFEGEDCYIVRGLHPHGFIIDMWISKRDFLLRKVKQPNVDGGYALDIRRNVKLNAQIPSDIFNFNPPPPKPKPRIQVCGVGFVLLVAVCLACSHMRRR